MLLKYGAKNFFCFREAIEISFKLGANCPKSISHGDCVANLLCVKGANGSGKTNALKIMSFMKYFCSDSFALKPEEDIYIDSYFFNEDPIDIFCEFQIDDVQYLYEVSLTNKKILSEVLFRKVKKMTEVFRREENKVEYCTKEFNELNIMKLRTNASIISTAHQYDYDCITPIHDFFDSIMTNVNCFGRFDLFEGYNKISEYYEKDSDLFDFAKNIIKKCDLGIKDIVITSHVNEEEKKVFFPIFEHETTSKQNKLGYLSQSSGTKALYTSLPYYKYILDTGSVLILDEFDINYHPQILPLLVGLFEDKEMNLNNAQLLFTTHNTDIMDNISKYRIVLINQDESESYGYRLDEISGDILRNDRPITPVYRSGKIGGVPRV